MSTIGVHLEGVGRAGHALEQSRWVLGYGVPAPEKAPVIDTTDRCRSDATYPQEVALHCRILDATTATYTARLHHGTEDTHGRDVFVIPYEDVLRCRYDEIEFEQP